MNESIVERLKSIGVILSKLPVSTEYTTFVTRQTDKVEYQDVENIKPLHPFKKSSVFLFPRNIKADSRPLHVFRIPAIDALIFIPKDKTQTKAFCWIQSPTKQKLWVEANTPDYLDKIEGVIYLLEMLDDSATTI